MKKEIEYYVKHCMKYPTVLTELLPYVLKRFNSKIKHILMKNKKNNSFCHYPKSVRSLSEKVTFDVVFDETWIDNLPSTGWLPGDGPSIISWSVPLAKLSIPFEDINWFKLEKDEEDTFSLHRFLWLLRWISLRPGRECLKVADYSILSWINQVRPINHRSAWETYSASERVVNWLLYICATKNYRCLEPFESKTIFIALLEHINHIVYHLEYQNESCNNHILNNARALYIAARLMHIPEVAILARHIILLHVPKMIDRQGALVEASTHYQLLLTRTIHEILWVAITTGDVKFSEQIKSIFSSMVSCCIFIGDSYIDGFSRNYPLVGDVSPDCPVTWYYPNIKNNTNSESWWNIWDAKAMQSFVGEACSGKLNKRIYDAWKWVGEDGGLFKVFMRGTTNSVFYPGSHGHLDFSSFLVYDHKGPILVDRGRETYSGNASSFYGISSRSHNATLINSLPILPDCRGIFISYNKHLSYSAELTADSEYAKKKIQWRTNSLNRLNMKLSWQKILVLSIDNIECTESIYNPSRNHIIIESFLHWAPGWEIYINGDSTLYEKHFILMKGEQSYRFIIYIQNVNIKVEKFNGDKNNLYGWHFPDYGCRVPALTLRLCVETEEDCELKYIMCQV